MDYAFNAPHDFTYKSNTGHSSHTYSQTTERQIYQYFKSCSALHSSNALLRLFDKEKAKILKLSRKNGLKRCRRATCPHCHYLTQRQGQATLKKVISFCSKNEVDMYFLTLSIGNQENLTLFELKNRLINLWQMVKGKFKRTKTGKEAFILSGMELIYLNDWFPHIHAIIIMKRTINDENWERLLKESFHKQSQILRYGEVDIDLKPLNNPKTLATYLYKTWWLEVNKESKNLFDLLSEALNGVVGALELFLEGSCALKGLQNYRLPPILKQDIACQATKQAQNVSVYPIRGQRVPNYSKSRRG